MDGLSGELVGQQGPGAGAGASPKLKRRRFGLFAKYFAFIVLLVSGGLVASGAIGLYFSYQETRNSLVNLQREKALTAAVRIEQFLRDIESQLGWTTLPMVAPVQSPMEGRRLDFLKVLRQLPAVTEVVHLDGQGREQLMVSRLAMDRVGAATDLSADPRFVEARKGKTWFGPVYFRKETEPYMTISIPEARDRPGVTVVDVNLKFIWDVVSRIRIGQKGVAYVVDDKGFLVAHPDISLVLKKVNLSNLPQVKESLGASREATWKETADARDVNGEKVLSASARIDPTGWRVFVEEPVTEVFAPLYDAMLRTIFLLLAGVVISIFASVFLARRMVLPVKALQKGAERIGAGDLSSRIEIKTGDELEGLADRFNMMSVQLKESYADLEKKVEDRTAELRASLDQQTATAEVLRVLSGSLQDVQPVLDAIVSSCLRLLGDCRVTLRLVHDGMLRRYASAGPLSDVTHYPVDIPLDSTSGIGTAVLEGRLLHVPDLREVLEEYPRTAVVLEAGLHSALIAPLISEGKCIGGLAVNSPRLGPFTEREISALQTFADQAVIAIQNVRLFNEIQEKSAQLEIANKHKSEFLANMSHELRTPLNAIIGFSEVILNGMAGPVADDQREFVTDIRDSGKHLLTLINDILDLSKIEAGRMELDIARFDMPVAIDNAMTLVRGRAERGGVKLATEITADVQEYEGDERKFKQIILNLLSNAVKFTPEGGKVTLGAHRENGAYVISVSDTGIGIAPEDQGRIFEEFQQVGSDYARKAEGTGLGLTLTKRLVELHGGAMSVTSAVGIGSTFTFTLPLRGGP